MQFRFGDCVLDVARRELWRSGERVAMEPQVFDLLVHLIRNRDRVVTKDDLLDAVWGGRIVSESTLTSRINAARKAVGDSGEAQRLIRTLPRKGIRFVADVTDAELSEPPPLPSLPHSWLDRPSIAVLPFDNLGGDREQEYFADGIVAEIITGLSRIKWLFVISRNSTFFYKGKPIDVKTVGLELGVRYVLEGTVRRAGNHVRVTGQLIETESAAHVWADRFDSTLDDIFALQDEMTMNVIGAVEPTLRKAEVERARRKRPDNLGAYDLYLRALPFAATAMPEDADKALRLLEEAIRLEPNYAIVHGFIAWCHEQRYLRGGLRAETREVARKHAHAAITNGSDDAMALAMGGFVIAVTERDYTTALDALDRALALSPSSALAFGFSSIVRAWIGDTATAIGHARIGIRLSPYDPLIYLPYVGLAYANFFAGDWAEAANAARRASNANPLFSVPCYLLTAALIRLGQIGEAKASSRRVLELQPGFTVGGLVSGGITTPERMAILADALRQAGLPE
jgi:TolB-like protein/tetratricopeptide (TPR) repeat protein